MDKRVVVRPCGNPKCGVSTGIHGGLTFGSGKLDFNGFWEFPCIICEKVFQENERRETILHECKITVYGDGRINVEAPGCSISCYLELKDTSDYKPYLKRAAEMLLRHVNGVKLTPEQQTKLKEYIKSDEGKKKLAEHMAKTLRDGE